MFDVFVIMIGVLFGLLVVGIGALLGTVLHGLWTSLSDCGHSEERPLHVVASLYCAQVGCEEVAVQAVLCGELHIALCEDHHLMFGSVRPDEQDGLLAEGSAGAGAAR